MNNFLIELVPQTFDATQLAEFLDMLRTMDQHTVRTSIASAAAVEFNEGGYLRTSGFAVAPLAFQQICRYVSKGLLALASDIGGINSGTRGYDAAISIPLAMRIVNDCIKLRFRTNDGLIGRDMILDHDSRILDGVVGPRYQLLPNYQLLDAVDEMLKYHDVPMHFYTGTLIGRRMSIVYLTKEPIAQLADGPVFGGAYFTNSEAGECAVRGATLLQIGKTLRCMNKLRHLQHAGKDFNKKLSQLLGSILGTWDATAAVVKTAQQRLDMPLNLLVKDTRKLNKALRSRLQLALGEHIDKCLANAVVRRAIFAGADGAHIPQSVRAEEIATRTVRDVVFILMKTAVGQHPEVGEGLARAAFEVLAGKIKLGT